MENYDNGSGNKMNPDEIEAIVRQYLEKNMTDATGKTVEEFKTIERIIEQTTF